MKRLALSELSVCAPAVVYLADLSYKGFFHWAGLFCCSLAVPSQPAMKCLSAVRDDCSQPLISETAKPAATKPGRHVQKVTRYSGNQNPSSDLMMPL